ncbi:MAG: LysR family transcriptional regulator [Sandaracinus sp.]|nr:LysR family transcriptional regulator [Sandaracinus sp.]MCB9617604.1 LysR family transcriptional regulator [Sandaracinus sp.]MCB9619851.1 LysR family transcriptional regulator [Sandaracinus sp.]MCB9622838.1 LysR family transcriptional regulator [Sandaracinus sp.]
MHGAIPSSEDLETFLAIAEAGSLTAAARAMRQPKSTLSRRLARLEELLGVHLLVRNRHRLELSETGVALLEPARQALTMLRELANAADQSRAVPEGRLRVSIPIDLLGKRELWLGFAERFPNVALELEPTNRHVDPVAERFDLALRGGRGPDETLVARPVGSYRLIAVASPEYVARFGPLEEPAALRRHSCILFRAMGHRPGHPDRPELPHRHIICPDEGSALEGARRGLGVAILRAEVVQSDVDSGVLVPVLDAYDPLVVPVYAVYPERSHLRAAVTAFIDYVSKHLS